MPPLHRIRLSVKGVQRPIPHFHTLWVDLDAGVDVFQCVVPAVSQVFAVGLGLPRSGEAQLFVRSSLGSVSLLGTDSGLAGLTASGMLSFPASFRQMASTAALSVA